MGSFERFTTKAHFNSLKRLVLVVGLAVLAVKLVIAGIWPGTAGSPLGLLARVAASLADLGASLRLTLGLPDRGPEGRILVVSTRHGPSGSWSTRSSACCASTRPSAGRSPTGSAPAT